MSTDVSGMIECRPWAKVWGEDDEDAVWTAAIDLFLLNTGNAYDALACLFGVETASGSGRWPKSADCRGTPPREYAPTSPPTAGPSTSMAPPGSPGPS
jgi:hypothetical protein